MRGYNIDNYIGKKFNQLTLIKNLNKLDSHNSKLALFECECCGNTKEMVFTQVLSGDVKTCGCQQGHLSVNSRKQQRKSKINFHINSIQKNNKTGYTRNL